MPGVLAMQCSVKVERILDVQALSMLSVYIRGDGCFDAWQTDSIRLWTGRLPMMRLFTGATSDRVVDRRQTT